jgi:hypothetical protein
MAPFLYAIHAHSPSRVMVPSSKDAIYRSLRFILQGTGKTWNREVDTPRARFPSFSEGVSIQFSSIFSVAETWDGGSFVPFTILSGSSTDRPMQMTGLDRIAVSVPTLAVGFLDISFDSFIYCQE